MSVSPARRELLELLDNLTDSQVKYLVQFVKSMQTEQTELRSYDPEADPLVGFISGPTDVADHVEDRC